MDLHLAIYSNHQYFHLSKSDIFLKDHYLHEKLLIGVQLSFKQMLSGNLVNLDNIEQIILNSNLN